MRWTSTCIVRIVFNEVRRAGGKYERTCSKGVQLQSAAATNQAKQDVPQDIE